MNTITINLNPQAAAATRHLYEIESYTYDGSGARKDRLIVKVNANRRDSAAKFASDRGYHVASVNMVG